ncbi:TPA: GntR family transcriptional regulator [Enterobacter hormaechei subsp. steigerwaltii]|nr:GntR family transcriptional regulator [Enterobacter hormaechei subsp. steigerwaltii]HAV1625068.1 GntR family transcriptional regulator [Enterobacter hormaechei subsp. steigerwaltii]HAV1658784.1 GntR family transcriptional regulator [Enterobacter hormaechei subsp. steigerwaltii]
MEKKHKYWEIKERIKKDILNEVYKKGESIPSERDLAGIYDVTRVTVQKAMAMLVQEGYIERIHGKGMFVLKNTASNIYILNNEKSDSILGFSREFQGRVNVTSRLLTLTTLHANAALAQHLEIAQGDDVWFIRRIRLLDGQPVLIEDSNIPHKVVATVPQAILEVGSLYGYIEDFTGKKISDADSLIEADLFDEELAAHLNILPGQPMLKITEVTRLDDGRAFNFSISYNRADIFRVKNMHIKR